MVSAVSSSRNQTIGADSAQGGGGKKDDDKEVKYGKSRRVSAYVSHVSETEKRGGPGEGFKKKNPTEDKDVEKGGNVAAEMEGRARGSKKIRKRK